MKPIRIVDHSLVCYAEMLRELGFKSMTEFMYQFGISDLREAKITLTAMYECTESTKTAH